MKQILEKAFDTMIKELELTRLNGFEPNRYHETASISESNLIYHFVKSLDCHDQSTIYLEFPCDSGRIDALVLYENNVLLIEAKTGMNNKKHKILDAQASRFENKKGHFTIPAKEIENKDKYIKKYFIDSSLRDTLEKRVLYLMHKKWNIKSNVKIYGILLADTLSKNEMDKWDYRSNSKHFETYKLDCLKTYTALKVIPKKNKDNRTIWYMGSYKHIDTIENIIF